MTAVLPAPALAVAVPGLGAPLEQRQAEAFATALRDAIASGDARQVQPLFPGGGEAFTWLGARWSEMRRGTLSPATWEANFNPYYVYASRMGGTLTLTARDAQGVATTGRFELEAVRRGRAWVVADALPLRRPDVRITRHDLRIDLREAGKLSGEDVLTLQPTGPDPRFFLTLQPGLKVSAVAQAGTPVGWQQHGELVYLNLPARSDAYPLSVTYGGTVSADAAMIDHVSADGALLRAGQAWYPRPVGTESPTVFRLMAMVAPGQQVVASGDFVGVDRFADGWLHHWTTPVPTEGEALIAGRLARAEARGAVVGLSAYVREGHEAAAAPLLAETARLTAFYAKRWGMPAFTHLAMVENGAPVPYSLGGALALPTAAFEHGETADAWLGPAVAQGWTGRRRYVGTPGERGFMAEGVAAYMGLLYHGDRDGVPAFRKGLVEAQKRYALALGTREDVAIAQMVPLGDREPWQRVIWDKGCVVLHMLRLQIGDAAFNQGLAALYAGQAEVPVDVTAFRGAFETASGKHLGAFFDQWLGRAGRPEIEVEVVKTHRFMDGTWEVRGVLRQAGRPFFMQVPLVVVGKSMQRVYLVEMRGAETLFRLTLPAPPLTLLVDPLRDTLAGDPADVEI